MAQGGRRRGGGRPRRPHLDPLAPGRLILSDEAQLPHGRDHFEAALAADLTAGARSEDAAVARTLSEARIEAIGEVPYGSNAVFIVQLAAADPSLPDEPMRAVYKPVRGERPLWDFPRHTLYLREVATYLVSAALDLPYVPPTVLRDGPLGPGSLQLFVKAADGAPAADVTDGVERELREVAMLDVLVNNADRKTAHLMLRHDLHIAAIDNALTFLPYPRQRTALIALGGTSLPRHAIAKLRALVADETRLQLLREHLVALLSPREVAAFMHRVHELHDDPRYPVLDDWDGRPFEWW